LKDSNELKNDNQISQSELQHNQQTFSPEEDEDLFSPNHYKEIHRHQANFTGDGNLTGY